MTDAELVAALAEALLDHVPEETSRGYVCDCGDQGGQSWREHTAAALLPIVRRVAEQRAAEELRAAADVLGFTPLSERESGVVSHYTAALHAGARIVSLRAAALTATPNHGRSAT